MTGRMVDKNHAAIRDALRAAGHNVIDTSKFGDGFPDLVAANKDTGIIYLFENKSRMELTKSQLIFLVKLVIKPVRIITTPEQAVKVLEEGWNQMKIYISAFLAAIGLLLFGMYLGGFFSPLLNSQEYKILVDCIKVTLIFIISIDYVLVVHTLLSRRNKGN